VQWLGIGQVAAQFENIMPAADVVQEIWQEFLKEKERLANI
tara:strand:+ start:140 stop:262 length:123 start_codon:yes stop_codon:yes gene_type:complete